MKYKNPPISKNIIAFEVDGTFDDCQKMVKKAFLDKDLTTKKELTSANSINVARWLPQMFYFMFAYKQLKQKYTFEQLCKTSELAAEVACGPVEEFDFDIAILFSDILFVLEGLGLELEFKPGPIFNEYLTKENYKKQNKDLKNKVSNALLNFKDKGLTVEQKNGRIYVSMEAKLLFPSGSTTVNPEGKEALVDLAKVLEKQENITVLVEGHTDIDAYRGSGQIKDNWDLSVMRSTSVVKLMLENSTLDPTMLTAAGRGEFMPLDPAKTAEAKAKNRRIEIVLTPKFKNLIEIENSILSSISKRQTYKKLNIYEQLNTGYIRIFSDLELENKIYNTFDVILKISGIWETRDEYGITFKFYTI